MNYGSTRSTNEFQPIHLIPWHLYYSNTLHPINAQCYHGYSQLLFSEQSSSSLSPAPLGLERIINVLLGWTDRQWEKIKWWLL